MLRREFLQTTAGAFAAGKTRRPNILFFFPDQHRFDWTGLNAALAVRTPNLNALARRGVQFTRAVVASPVCAPSRACLAAGMEYERCGVRNNNDNFPIGKRTYYGMLRDSGYHVAVCGKADLSKPDHNWGLNGKRLLPEWGFSDGINSEGKFDAIRGADHPRGPYMAFLHNAGLAKTHVDDFRGRTGANSYRNTAPTPLPEDAYTDNWVAENGLSLLKEAPKDKPWHLVVNFPGPHNPVDITARMDQVCRGRDFPQPVDCTVFHAKKHIEIRQNYSAMVENIDRWLGIYLDEIKKRGELENTVIAFSSDHGEMLGDHNRWGKSVPYQPSIGIPMVFAGPGIRSREATDALVNHIDLAATFLDVAGVPVPKDMDARSLGPILRGRAKSHRAYLRSGLNEWRMVWDGRYKLITGFNGKETMLFDLASDPNEMTDIAAQSESQVARLRKLI